MKTTIEKCYLVLDGKCSESSIEQIEEISNDDGVEILDTTNRPQFSP